MKRPRFIITLLILLSSFVSSTVYASYTDSLRFTGSVVFTPPLNLELTNPAVKAIRPGESIDLDPDRKTMGFTVLLVEPGDQRVITFQIRNTGSNPALLQNLSPKNPDSSSGVSVQWPTMNNVVLDAASTSPEFTVLVMWEPSAIGAPEGVVNFSAAIQYTQYSPP